MTRTQVFSNGGGTQSTAIVALIAQGILPKPDYVITADTGREKQQTWDYINSVHRPVLEEMGVPVIIVPHSYATVDMYDSKGKTLMPMYTNLHGRVSKLPAYCSNEWKVRPVRRWMREQGVRECDQWLGISIDESDRMRERREVVGTQVPAA